MLGCPVPKNPTFIPTLRTRASTVRASTVPDPDPQAKILAAALLAVK